MITELNNISNSFSDKWITLLYNYQDYIFDSYEINDKVALGKKPDLFIIFSSGGFQLTLRSSWICQTAIVSFYFY